MRIFAYKHTINQAEISITEAHSNPLWSVDSRGAGQYQYLGTQLYSFSDFSNFFVIKVKDKIQEIVTSCKSKKQIIITLRQNLVLSRFFLKLQK